MEKIQVNDELKGQYLGLVKGAQSMESAIGAAQYRLHKLCEQRGMVDGDLKAWWEKVTEEYKLDKTKDFYVDGDGAINIVERPETQTPPTPPAAEPTVAPEPEAVVPEAPVAPVAAEPVAPVVEETIVAAETITDLN